MKMNYSTQSVAALYVAKSPKMANNLLSDTFELFAFIIINYLSSTFNVKVHTCTMFTHVNLSF